MARGGNGRERSKRRAVKRGKWDEKETFPFATAQSRMCIFSGHVLSSVQFCISSLLPLFWQGGRGKGCSLRPFFFRLRRLAPGVDEKRDHRACEGTVSGLGCRACKARRRKGWILRFSSFFLPNPPSPSFLFSFCSTAPISLFLIIHRLRPPICIEKALCRYSFFPALLAPSLSLRMLFPKKEKKKNMQVPLFIVAKVANIRDAWNARQLK